MLFVVLAAVAAVTPACSGTQVASCKSLTTNESCSVAWQDYDDPEGARGQGQRCMWYSAFPPAACIPGGTRCLTTKCQLQCLHDSDCSNGTHGCTRCHLIVPLPNCTPPGNPHCGYCAPPNATQG
eukprot:Hpha_TRINITY_DN4446_c0_g1::TRINITY_DN4446_c0_g1_i1::g.50308::m.50308